MSRYEDACPFEVRGRANRCESCCAAQPIPPCAAAYLSGAAALTPVNVISIRRVEAIEARKAA